MQPERVSRNKRPLVSLCHCGVTSAKSRPSLSGIPMSFPSSSHTPLGQELAEFRTWNFTAGTNLLNRAKQQTLSKV